MKTLIATMGPGETAQGLAVGQHFIEQGIDVEFGILLEENAKFFNEEFNVTRIENGDALKKLISSNRYDNVILCNSKIFRKDPGFQNQPPKNKPFIASLDSNWLFNQPDRYPMVRWIDHYFVNLPGEVYESGLKKNGGHYFVPDEISRNITSVGLIPSYKPVEKSDKKKIKDKLKIVGDQKLIFVYIGSQGHEATFRSDLLNKIIKLFDRFYEKHGENFKILFTGCALPEKPWLALSTSCFPGADFYNHLAASDLVIQHQGIGTLEQAISAQIPVISNVNFPDPNEKVNAHAWEVGPFQKVGLCKMHYYSDDVNDIVESSELLLWGKEGEAMSRKQADSYSCGEQILLKKISQLSS